MTHLCIIHTPTPREAIGYCSVVYLFLLINYYGGLLRSGTVSIMYRAYHVLSIGRIMY